MGGKSKAPKMSGAEKDLLRQQTEILKAQLAMFEDQSKQFALLAPFLFEEQGLKPIMDEEGNITGFEELPDELKALRKQSEKLLLERGLAALEGKLPVNKQLTDDLAESRRTLEESLRKTFGNDFLATTGGARAMAEFGAKEESLLDAARRGDITLAESLSLAREASNRGGVTQTLANVLGLQGAGNDLVNLQGQVAQGFNSPLQALANARALKTQFKMNQPNNFMAGAAGFGQLIGSLAMAPTTGGGSVFGSLFT